MDQLQLMPHLQDDPQRKAKWAYLTDGLKDQHRINCEVLLENEERYALGKTKRNPIFEDIITTANFPAFTTFSFPIIRRVFPRLIANELVSVQPMNQPTGKVFYFDITYAATGSPSVANRVDLLANFSASYAEAAEAATVPEIALKISSADVSAKSKKLKAKWDLESEQDLYAYFGLNAENELMTATSGEIAREIDREVIRDLILFAGAGSTNWSATVPGSYSGLDPKLYRETLYDAIVDANNQIFKKRYRNANWVVADPDTCARLEKLEQFRLFPSPDPTGEIVTGPHLFGTISSKYLVYKDPWMQASDFTPINGAAIGGMLVGYKGTGPLDTGYVFAPYIPLLTTAPFTDPNDMTTRRGMMTRYAKKGLIPECYATIIITA